MPDDGRTQVLLEQTAPLLGPLADFPVPAINAASADVVEKTRRGCAGKAYIHAQVSPVFHRAEGLRVEWGAVEAAGGVDGPALRRRRRLRGGAADLQRLRPRPRRPLP